MTAEYDINLSNGSVLATLYPLEVNGPDNRSTPRFIQDVQTSPNGFVLNGDLTYRFIEGFEFDVQNSGSYAGSPLTYFGNDGTYVVGAGGAVGIGSPVTQTFIPATLVGSPATGSPVAPFNTGLPFGQIQYTVPVTTGSPDHELNTCLKLPGKGTINYGEMIIEDLVRMTEHWASDVEPGVNTNIGSNPYGTPLAGQIWFKTLPGDEGFRYWDGTQWTDSIVVEPATQIVYGTGTGISSDANLTWDGNVLTVVGTGSPQIAAIMYGDIEMHSQMRAFDGAATRPSYSFGDGSPPASSSGMFYDNGVAFAVDAVERFVIEPDGTLKTLTASYENLVTSDNDIPNKKYVDDAVVGIGSPFGGGTPGGSNTQIQFNDNGSFGGSSNLTWDGTKLAVVAGGSPATVALDVTGDVEVNSQIRASDGSSSAPTYSFTSAPTTGTYRDPSGAMIFTIGGTNQWFIESGRLMNWSTGGADIGRLSPSGHIGDVYARSIAPNQGASGGIQFRDATLSALSGTEILTGVGGSADELLFNVAGGGEVLRLASTQATFKKILKVESVLRVAGSAAYNIRVEDGQIRGSSTLTTANSPGYAFVSDTTTGFFNKAPGEIGVAQDGYQRFGFEGTTGSPETGEVGEFRCYEAPDNGSAYVGIKAPTSISNGIIYTLPELPSGSPLTGYFLSVDENGIMSWDVPAAGSPSGGGGGTPAGVDTQIQYNDSGSFGAGEMYYVESASEYRTDLKADSSHDAVISAWAIAASTGYPASSATGIASFALKDNTGSTVLDLSYYNQSPPGVKRAELRTYGTDGLGNPVSLRIQPAGNLYCESADGVAALNAIGGQASILSSEQIILIGSASEGSNPGSTNWDTVVTSDTTLTDLLTVTFTGAPSTGHARAFNIEVAGYGRDEVGSPVVDGAAYIAHIRGAVKVTNSGTVALVGTRIREEFKDVEASAWSADVTVVGSPAALVVQVIGDPAFNVVWTARADTANTTS